MFGKGIPTACGGLFNRSSGALLLTSTLKSYDSLIEVQIYWNGTTSFGRFGRDALIN